MPTYDYVCSACGHRMEVIHGINAGGPEACPVCGGPMRKGLNVPAFHFKGSGWAKKDRRAAASTKAAAKAGVGSDGATDKGTDSPGGSDDGDGGEAKAKSDAKAGGDASGRSGSNRGGSPTGGREKSSTADGRSSGTTTTPSDGAD